MPGAASSETKVRSVERLRLIEEEIEKDYSKYFNEYGLTKTAFAQAVNAIREKQSGTKTQQFSTLRPNSKVTSNQISNEKQK